MRAVICVFGLVLLAVRVVDVGSVWLVFVVFVVQGHDYRVDASYEVIVCVQNSGSKFWYAGWEVVRWERA